MSDWDQAFLKALYAVRGRGNGSGPSSFKLNHLPLAWASGAYIGPVRMSMVVTVEGSGNRFSGLSSQTLYQASPTPGHEFDQSAPVVTITGTITATRMTP